jgi:hypothetical protein
MATVRVRIAILTVRITLSVCPFNRMAHTANSKMMSMVTLSVAKAKLFAATCCAHVMIFEIRVL